MTITIDDDALQDVTIDGDPVQRITIDGDEAWIRRTYVDDFSHADPSQVYSSRQESSPETFTTTTAWGDPNTPSLEPANLDGSTCRMRSWPEDSDWNDDEQPDTLEYYPEPGDEIHARFRFNLDHDGSFQGGSTVFRLQWAATGISDQLGAQISANLEGAPLQLLESGSIVESTNTDPWSDGDIGEFVINWGSTTTLECLDITNGVSKGTVSADLTDPGGRGVGWRMEDDRDPPIRFGAVWVE